jgi:hypothetical protein
MLENFSLFVACVCVNMYAHMQGCGYVFLTRQVRKQLAKNIERVSERGKNPRQTGEWACIFTRQS